MDHEASNGLESVGIDAVDFFSGHATNSGAHQSSIKLHTTDQAHAIVKAHWGSTFRHYFNANSSSNTVVSTSYSSEHSLLVVHFTLPKSHTAAVTAVEFAYSTVVLTASLDDTVRAYDLHRYRNFKTYTSEYHVSV
jgi:hypothetical protein